MSEEVDIIQEEVEYPPLSVNQAFKGRRFKTDKYDKWRFDLELLLENKHKKIVKGYVEVEVHYYIKTFNRSDCDNLIKTFFDSLKNCGYFEDDVKVVHLDIWKHKIVECEKIKFIIKKYEYHY